MKVGIPKGLLYYKYYPFAENFFSELGAEIISSPNTNKEILNLGMKYCVDEACLPVKIFHGHVFSIKDKCDLMFIPRIMQLKKEEFICPKFCGLPEMIMNSIPNMPKTITQPIYAFSKQSLKIWVRKTGRLFTKNTFKVDKAYKIALKAQEEHSLQVKKQDYKIMVALVGHPYNIYDDFLNMNIIKKLNKLGIGVITEESVEEQLADAQIKQLFKKPFWTFFRKLYGYATYVAENKKVTGIIYLSSFSCGIDSVVIETIKDRLGRFPFLVLKIDEQTGEAGMDTRIEAFVDMLERRCV